MSQNASTNFVTSFDAMVKGAYQGEMKLRNTVRLKTGVVGSTHRFPKMGKGLAQPRVPQTDVIPMNVTHGHATATLTDWSAPEYTDVYDIEKLNFDEKKELAKIVGQAMGRRLDQLILDALASGANSTQVGVNVGGSNSGLIIEKFLRAKRLMDDKGVPSQGRHMAVSAYSIETALSQEKIGSTDYNTVKALATGELDGYAGFKIHMIESRDEGGLPLSTNVRNNFAWHQDAVGLAIGLDMRVDVDYISEKTSWLTNGLFSAGAVVIDNEGAFDVLTYEA